MAATDETPIDSAALMAENPVAVLLLLDPRPPYAQNALDALSAFENRLFAPYTPSADQYQVVLDQTWNEMTMTVFVFPERHLDEFAEILRDHGLALARGVPTAIGSGGVDRYSPAEALSKGGISVGDRTYVIERAPASGAVLREGAAPEAVDRFAEAMRRG